MTSNAVAAGSDFCGGAEIEFAVRDGTTRLVHLFERNPLRVLFPRPEVGDPTTAVLVTTSGGLVAGDQVSISTTLGSSAAAHVTASAAEKIYRSPGATTKVAQSFSIADGGWLEFLPPETILFDGARLRRQTRIDIHGAGGFLGGGIIVFGRRARGETFSHGLLHEHVEVYRDGRLIWGDAMHLDGDIAALMANAACFDNAAACATLIMLPPDGAPARFVAAACDVQQRADGPDMRAGVTAVNGVLVARWLAADALPLRRAYAELACHLRAAAMGLPPRLPRLWHV